MMQGERLGPNAAGYPHEALRLLGRQAPSAITVRGNFDILDTHKVALFCSVSCPGNLIVQNLLAPDVTLEGQMCVSLGFGFTAVPGTFTP